MAISARYDALDSASQQFGRVYSDIGDAQLAVASALRLAAAAAGDDAASAAISALSGRVTSTLDDACSRMLDIAGGLHGAIETYRNVDRSVADVLSGGPQRPGRPR